MDLRRATASNARSATRDGTLAIDGKPVLETGDQAKNAYCNRARKQSELEEDVHTLDPYFIGFQIDLGRIGQSLSGSHVELCRVQRTFD